MARFVNHSCKPNCMTQKWHVMGEVRVGLFALTNITQDEELTIDYNFGILKNVRKRCLCGAFECTGYLGTASKDQIDQDLDENSCKVCHRSTDDTEDKLIACESCDDKIHLHCFNPLLIKNTMTGWTCMKCRDQVKTEFAQISFQQNQKSREDMLKNKAPWETNLKLYTTAKSKQDSTSSEAFPGLKANKQIIMEEEEVNRENPDYAIYEKQYNFFKQLEIEAKHEMYQVVEHDEVYAPLAFRSFVKNEQKVEISICFRNQ